MLRYEIVPDDAGNTTLDFFWINEADGEIVVKRLLSESPLSSFSVSIILGVDGEIVVMRLLSESPLTSFSVSISYWEYFPFSLSHIILVCYVCTCI